MPSDGRRIHHYQALILEVVAVMGSASAQAVFHELRRHGARVGLSTVYRTLQLLVDLGTLWALSFADQTVYEAASSTVMDAFTCFSCGHTVRLLRPRVNEVPGPAGFLIAPVPVVVSGVCASCSPIRPDDSPVTVRPALPADDLADPH